MGISVNKINFHFSILTQKLPLTSCFAWWGHPLPRQVLPPFCLDTWLSSKPIPSLIMDIPHNSATLCPSLLYQQARGKLILTDMGHIICKLATEHAQHVKKTLADRLLMKGFTPSSVCSVAGENWPSASVPTNIQMKEENKQHPNYIPNYIRISSGKTGHFRNMNTFTSMLFSAFLYFKRIFSHIYVPVTYFLLEVRSLFLSLTNLTIDACDDTGRAHWPPKKQHQKKPVN